jgi:hypothetical protein
MLREREDTGADVQPPLIVPWDRAAELVGDLLVPQGLVHERYRVERSPSPEQLERLREHATG